MIVKVVSWIISVSFFFSERGSAIAGLCRRHHLGQFVALEALHVPLRAACSHRCGSTFDEASRWSPPMQNCLEVPVLLMPKHPDLQREFEKASEGVPKCSQTATCLGACKFVESARGSVSVQRPIF